MRRRKLVTVAFALAHRAAWILLILLLYVDWPQPVRLSVMVCTLLVSNICSVIAGNAWFSWMADLVPTTVRGSYYGRRNSYLGLTSLVTLFLGSQLLSFFRRVGMATAGYTICFSVAVASALFAAWMLSRQYEPSLKPVPKVTPGRLFQLLTDKPLFKKFIRFYVTWNFSHGVAAAFFGVYMVKVLHMSPALMGCQALVMSGMAWFGSRIWGRAIDRVGDRPVALTCGMLIAAHIWIWMPSRADFLLPVWITAAVGGFCWSGFNIVVFSWQQRMCGVEERQYTFGITGMFAGPAFMLGSLCGGVLTQFLPEVLFTFGDFRFLHYHLLFAFSSLGRGTAIGLIAYWSHQYDRQTRTFARCVIDTFSAILRPKG